MASSITPDPAIQLFYAVCNGDADNVKSLLARQPPPAINAKHSRDSRGFHVNSATALHIACERRNIEIVRILLEKGASPHTLDGKRRTPLHLAAGARSIEIIRSLLSWVQDREGYVDLRDEQGNTPLLVACAQPQRAGEDRNMDVLSHLLAEGADLRAINNDGETAAHRATRDSGDLEILKYLGDNARELLGLQTIFMGRNSNTCLHLATWLGRVQHVEWLLEAMRYADIRKEDADGRTAWDIACGLRAHGTDLSSFQVSSTFAEKEGGVMDPSLQWHRIAEVGSLKTYALWTHNVSTTTHNIAMNLLTTCVPTPSIRQYSLY
ncbi:ankyrin [Lophiostoma macrostomum CBS 122681]|uniref:Ankyrin n=1 Tax=Lophiostoma macrostomum CBS 122681 TaxID=1314788 RepID=A0A6A6SVM9_9PLEO|nr:ankyrin [Lophiostoma macrostomum CBS 122681]